MAPRRWQWKWVGVAVLALAVAGLHVVSYFEIIPVGYVSRRSSLITLGAVVLAAASQGASSQRLHELELGERLGKRIGLSVGAVALVLVILIMIRERAS